MGPSRELHTYDVTVPSPRAEEHQELREFQAFKVEIEEGHLLILDGNLRLLAALAPGRWFSFTEQVQS